jgi:hypothetical protein
MARHGWVQCEACEQVVPKVRPSRLWWVAVVLVFVWTFVMTPLLVFPLSVAFIPWIMGIAVPVLGYVSDKVYATPLCPECGRSLARAPEAAPHLHGAPGLVTTARATAAAGTGVRAPSSAM